MSEQLCEPGPDELDDEVLILSRKLNNLVNITINDSSKKPTNQKNHERNNIFEDTKNTLNSSLIKKMNRTALNGRRALSKSGICQVKCTYQMQVLINKFFEGICYLTAGHRPPPSPFKHSFPTHLVPAFKVRVQVFSPPLSGLALAFKCLDKFKPSKILSTE